MSSPFSTGVRDSQGARVPTPTPSPFDSSRLNQNLNRRMASGGIITISSQAAKFVIRLGSMVALARLLTPADFGLVASVSVVTGFVGIFKEEGLSMATIQREKITHEQVSTLFWISVAIAVLTTLVELALAPAVAWFYGEPQLAGIMVAIAVVTLIGCISMHHNALLRRNMQFGRLAAIDLASTVIGITIACFMAWLKCGYWSLIGMMAGLKISRVIFSFIVSGWIPGMPSRRNGVGSMVRFGGNLAGANFFIYLTRNADNFFVGFMNGAAALGIYSRGYSLFLAPLQYFLAPISAVVIPALSRTTTNPARFRSILIEKSYLVIFVVILMTGFTFCTAPELVTILLGPGWAEASRVVRCLASGEAISVINVAGGWVSATQGGAYRQFRVAMVAGPTYAIAFFLGSHYGPVGVACAFSITCTLFRYPAFCYLLKDTPIDPCEFIMPLLRVGTVAATAAAAGIFGAQWFSHDNIVIILATKTGVFASVVSLCLLARLLALPSISRDG